jgi:hypothetical protein
MALMVQSSGTEVIGLRLNPCAAEDPSHWVNRYTRKLNNLPGSSGTKLRVYSDAVIGWSPRLKNGQRGGRYLIP